jgi:hypothetical protein
MWWASFTNGTEAWDTVGDRKAMRALCVRPYVFPAPEESLQASASTQPAIQLQSAAARGSNQPASSAADAYYDEGKTLARQATVDERTAKVIYPPGCVEAFQKYLQLEPNGPHANEVRSVLALGGGTAAAH